MLVFALLVILIFNFAIELQPNLRSTITPGVLWVTFAFAGTLGLNRSMAVEKDRGCLDGLLLAPVDRSAIYFGKAMSNLAFMLIVAIVVLPVYSVLYNINVFNPGLLVSYFSWFNRVRCCRDVAFQHGSPDPHTDVLLPVLLFPVIVPVLLAAVKASGGFLQNLPMSEIWPWLNILIAYDVIFTAVAYMVFDYVVEE